jgi:hypothetical protein
MEIGIEFIILAVLTERILMQIKNDLVQDIIDNMEWLDTLVGDEVPCISIENLIGILEAYFIINNEEAKEIYDNQ